MWAFCVFSGHPGCATIVHEAGVGNHAIQSRRLSAGQSLWKGGDVPATRESFARSRGSVETIQRVTIFFSEVWSTVAQPLRRGRDAGTDPGGVAPGRVELRRRSGGRSRRRALCTFAVRRGRSRHTLLVLGARAGTRRHAARDHIARRERQREPALRPTLDRPRGDLRVPLL